MRELGLVGDDSWLSHDSWEIAREYVVLNRKLGIGAFGTVYGGEARISDTWVAVAVKTLKIGSNTEDKVSSAIPHLLILLNNNNTQNVDENARDYGG